MLIVNETIALQQRKLDIYRETRHYVSLSVGNSICWSLCKFGKLPYKDIHYVFPELKLHSPTRTDHLGYWWNRNEYGQQQRLLLLDTIIEELTQALQPYIIHRKKVNDILNG